MSRRITEIDADLRNLKDEINETGEEDVNTEDRHPTPEAWKKLFQEAGFAREEPQEAVAGREAATVDLDLLGNLTPRQIEVLANLREKALELVNHPSARIETLDVSSGPGGKVWIRVVAVRTDCDRDSTRALFSGVTGTFKVWSHGGIEVNTYLPNTPQSVADRYPYRRGFRRGL